jgi:CBS domain containing-hemolysin-like protein
MLTLLYIIFVFFLVLANGFFVASEFALVGVRRSRIEMLAATGRRSALRLLGLLDNLNAYISATQLGITMASLALGWIWRASFRSLTRGSTHLLEEIVATWRLSSVGAPLPQLQCSLWDFSLRESPLYFTSLL